MKEYQKALNRAYEIISDLDFRSQLECADQFKIIQKAVDKANKYDEKETPKKVKPFPNSFYIKTCPNCGSTLEIVRNYCDECGQRLDWSDKVCRQK